VLSSPETPESRPMARRYKKKAACFLSPARLEEKQAVPVGDAEPHLFDRLRSAPDLGLACHFPRQVGGAPGLTPRLPAKRRYLELVLRELDLLSHRLGERRPLNYLWWLGDCEYWLDPTEMTELMFRISQRFHATNPHLQAATIEVQTGHQSPDFLALCRGLGFTHLVTSKARMTGDDEPIKASGLTRALTLEDAPAPANPQIPLVSLGMGGRWHISGRVHAIANQIGSYSAALKAGRIPWAATPAF